MATNEIELEETGHSFAELFATFVAGTPITRKHWGGYWRYHKGQIEMHCENGDVINFTDTKDILFTVSHVLQRDWIVYSEDKTLYVK